MCSRFVFDEGDAVFARRKQFEDIRDRYANLEIDYLPERIGRAEGAIEYRASSA
jgi:hypothetical protein